MNASQEKPPGDPAKLGMQGLMSLALTMIVAVGGAVYGFIFGLATAGDPDAGDGIASVWDYVFWIPFGIGMFGILGALLGGIAGGLFWLVWFLLHSARKSFASRFARPS